MERRGWKNTVTYVGLLGAAFVVAVAGSWKFGRQLDSNAYDFMFRLYEPPPWRAEAVVLAIDEATLNACGGMPRIRGPLAGSLKLVAAAGPKAVASWPRVPPRASSVVRRATRDGTSGASWGERPLAAGDFRLFMPSPFA